MVAVAVSSLALLIAGKSPITTFQEMWKAIDGTEPLVSIVNRAVPYYIAGVAVAIGFKMRLFNIGVDGQYRLAALFAAAFGSASDRGTCRRRCTCCSSRWSRSWSAWPGRRSRRCSR